MTIELEVDGVRRTFHSISYQEKRFVKKWAPYKVQLKIGGRKIVDCFLRDPIQAVKHLDMLIP